MAWSAMDPNDIRDYWFDWGSTDLKPDKRFLPDTVVITSSVVTFPEGITKIDDEFEDKLVRFRASSPVGLGLYLITNLITVSTGEQFECTKTLEVKERIS